MNELAAALLGFYIVFNRRWLWSQWVGASNEGRVLFGICVYLAALWWWWSR